MRAKRTISCRCPYCDQPLIEEEYCKPCGVQIYYCPNCEKPIPQDAITCPECGCEIENNQRRKRKR
ncbi:MAG: zinc-ribbon domain-containing protein [bacterium]